MAVHAETAVPLPLLRRGKVRDVYIVDDARLLLVASDRVSAFDVVLPDPIPSKGAVLTQMTAWWLAQFGEAMPHHLITADVDRIIDALPALAPQRSTLVGRAMLCHRTTVFPVECVIRGYIAGSMWKEYTATGTLAGEPVPAGLLESDRLPTPIFSPATKAETGHDENITVAEAARVLGADVARVLEQKARWIYERGNAIARDRRIIIADTKFEFGSRDGEILLIDEVLTPDSSRFWGAEHYAPGRSQPSFDKQPLRDWLDAERRAGRWNGEAPGPRLPADIIAATSQRYIAAYERVTGHPFPEEYRA